MRVYLVGSEKGVPRDLLEQTSEFSSSSTGEIQESPYRLACQQIGEMLARKGHTLIVQSIPLGDLTKTTDAFAVRGANRIRGKRTQVFYYQTGDLTRAQERLREGYSRIQSFYYRSGGEAGKTPVWFVPGVLNADIIVAVGGAQGTQQVIEWADQLGRLVVGLPRYGGAPQGKLETISRSFERVGLGESCRWLSTLVLHSFKNEEEKSQTEKRFLEVLEEAHQAAPKLGVEPTSMVPKELSHGCATFLGGRFASETQELLGQQLYSARISPEWLLGQLAGSGSYFAGVRDTGVGELLGLLGRFSGEGSGFQLDGLSSLYLAYEFAQDTTTTKLISPRHIFAALLSEDERVRAFQLRCGLRTQEGKPSETLTMLREMLYESISSMPSGDDLLKWAGLLVPSRPLLLDVNNDVATGSRKTDRMGIMPDVEMLCSVLARERVKPPLALGLFGEWGSGKSFFMDCMKEEIERLTALGRNPTTKFHKEFHDEVLQIRFNAWHYADQLLPSLVSEIFEKIASYGIPEANSTEAQAQAERVRKELSANLESAKEAKGAAQERHDKAIAEQESAQRALVEAQSRLEAAPMVEVPLDVRALWVKLLLEDKDLRNRWHDIQSQLGITPEEGLDPERLRELSSGLVGFGGRFRASVQLLQKLNQQHGRQLLPFALPLLVALVPVGVFWDQGGLPYLTSATTGALTFVATLSPILRQVSTATQKIQTFAQDAEAKVQESKEAFLEKRQLEARRKLEERERAERVVQESKQQLEEATRKVEKANEELESIQSGRVLSRFVQQKSGDYQTHLGLISTVRRDFQRLIELLQRHRQDESSPLPKIDRIILYIDDLDRCSPGKVMEVLHTVHLLLALDLFIVVIGIDPRWLARSLETHFESLFGERPPSQDRLAWGATPQDYLEKIIQIPFTIQRISATSTELIKTLIGAKTASSQQPAAQGNVSAQQAAPSGSSSGALAGEGASPAPARSQVSPPEPTSLDFIEQEQRLMELLAPLLPSPRAIKRFVNTYLILKASHRGADFQRFIDPNGPFKAILFLLVVLIGFSSQAEDFFAKLKDPRSSTLWAVIDGLGDDGPRALKNRLTEEELRLRLLAELPNELDLYREVLTQVARFSFRPMQKV